MLLDWQYCLLCFCETSPSPACFWVLSIRGDGSAMLKLQWLSNNNYAQHPQEAYEHSTDHFSASCYIASISFALLIDSVGWHPDHWLGVVKVESESVEKRGMT